jgi:predicted DNA-binding protein
MAITTCKVTYSLRPETVGRVQELATQWGVPKSEVIRRVVEQAENLAAKEEVSTPLQALEWFRKNGISAEAAAKWNAKVLRERRAWGRGRK